MLLKVGTRKRGRERMSVKMCLRLTTSVTSSHDIFSIFSVLHQWKFALFHGKFCKRRFIFCPKLNEGFENGQRLKNFGQSVKSLLNLVTLLTTVPGRYVESVWECSINCEKVNEMNGRVWEWITFSGRRTICVGGC